MPHRGPIQFIADTWAGLSWKKELEGRGELAKTWVGDHHRRLTAYVLLRALASNSGRHFLDLTPDARRKHREYGDARLIIEAVRAAVTGDDISLALVGIDPEKDEVAAQRIEELERWNDVERINASVIEVERDAQTIGDGVFLLTADSRKQRVRLTTIDAGWYFPVLDPNAPFGDFPRTVHLAYEFEHKFPDGATEPRIRRMTWELVDLDEPRRYAYDSEPSTVTCLHTDAQWTLDRITNRLGQVDVESFDVGRATEFARDAEGNEVRDLDLFIDFIPIVHIPNTVAIKAHYGESILLAISQVLQDLATADTAAAMAADLAGTPMIGVEDGNVSEITVRPGQVIPGKMTPLDLSASLDAIMKYIDGLSKRMTTNARVADAVLGRIQPGEIKSGLHYALMFGPMKSLVDELRLVRDEKYPLLYRFQQRMSIAYGWMQGPVQPVTVRFGSYLPSDHAAVIETVTKLYTEGLMSRATAIKKLVEEGIVDVDVAEELTRCEREDFEKALSLFEALGGGDDAADEVWKLLGKTRPENATVEQETPRRFTVPLAGVGAPNGSQPQENE